MHPGLFGSELIAAWSSRKVNEWNPDAKGGLKRKRQMILFQSHHAFIPGRVPAFEKRFRGCTVTSEDVDSLDWFSMLFFVPCCCFVPWSLGTLRNDNGNHTSCFQTLALRNSMSIRCYCLPLHQKTSTKKTRHLSGIIWVFPKIVVPPNHPF